jgi:hypothetical protein
LWFLTGAFPAIAAETQKYPTPEITQKAAKDGYDIVASSPAQFASDPKQEIATLERVIRENGIKTE